MAILALPILCLLVADGIDLKFEPSNMTQKLGGYRPIRAEMVGEAVGIKLPKGLKKPMFGKIDVSGKSFAFVLDEPAGAPPTLTIDTNGNADLGDDAPAKWSGRKQGEFTMYMGTGEVMVKGQKASLGVYRFDPNDPQRAALKNTLLYYTDFGYSGTATIGGKKYPIAFAGDIDPKGFYWIDRNSDGKSQSRAETIAIDKPFNFGNGSFVISVEKGALKVSPSKVEVAEILLPPDLRVGKDVLAFQAMTMDGKAINFPSSYKGKIVMLDFWATWCGPCIAELPNVTKAYEAYHDKGFEILSITLDDKDMTEKVNAFTKEHNMPWAQIYEGKAWECSLVQKYGVEGIPFVLLVDGDTGKILADSSKLRGPQISDTIAAALKAKLGG